LAFSIERRWLTNMMQGRSTTPNRSGELQVRNRTKPTLLQPSDQAVIRRVSEFLLKPVTSGFPDGQLHRYLGKGFDPVKSSNPITKKGRSLDAASFFI